MRSILRTLKRFALLQVGLVQIAMDDALFVCSFESMRDLLRDRERFVNGQRSMEPLRKRVAIHQFHDERWRAVGLFEAMNVRDVWMVERRKDLRFAAESCDPFRVAHDRRQHYFDRDVAIQLRV